MDYVEHEWMITGIILIKIKNNCVQTPSYMIEYKEKRGQYERINKSPARVCRDSR